MTSPRKKTPDSELPPSVVATWVWVRRRWPVIGLLAFVVLGTIALFLMRGLIHDVQETQKQGRRVVCALSNAITTNPIVRIPAFQTQEQFDRQVAALKLIIVLTKDIDCTTVLSSIIDEQGASPPVKKKGGGGAQSPQQGSQLPGGHGGPPAR